MNPADTSNEPPADLYRRAREKSLLLKWSKGGRLLQTEFEEIRHRLPADVVAAFEKAFAGGTGGILDDSGYARYEKSLAAYEEIFGTKVRQLKKYIAIGKTKTPPDLPPFDKPEAMAGWWVRNMTQRVPAKLLASARRQEPEEKGIDVKDYEGQIADALREARTLLAVATDQLKEAYKSGVDSRIEVQQRRWLKALQAVKATEQAAREDKKSSGELIPKAEIFPDLSELLQVLRHMRSNRRRHTLAKLADLDLTPQEREQIGAAVDSVREDEEKVLRRLKHFHSLEEIDQFQLNAGDE